MKIDQFNQTLIGAMAMATGVVLVDFFIWHRKKYRFIERKNRVMMEMLEQLMKDFHDDNVDAQSFFMNVGEWLTFTKLTVGA